jgi:hypothetical protein
LEEEWACVYILSAKELKSQAKAKAIGFKYIGI